MDLALQNRIDTDLRMLIVIDRTPTGDDLLDPILATLAEENDLHDARFWVERVADERSGWIQEQALARLVDHRILQSEGGRLLWVFRARRYPIIDGKAQREVRLRITQVLFSEEIPSPRDIVIICLADACRIFNHFMSEEDVERARERIDIVRRMDLIGRAVANAVQDIEASIAATNQRVEKQLAYLSPLADHGCGDPGIRFRRCRGDGGRPGSGRVTEVGTAIPPRGP